MNKLASRYDFEVVFSSYQKRYKESSVYKFNKEFRVNIENESLDFTKGRSVDNIFSIDTPPPTISGALHIGHVFSYCHTDFIARYQRMSGKNVFYPIGFDDNGLPTERLVEKQCKVKASKIEKSVFLDLCEKVSLEKVEDFRDLFEKIGLSVDWDLAYRSNSDAVKKISQSSFLRLYKKGFIYRKKMPVLWDIIDQTAIAQAEVEEKEFASHMNYIAFATEDKQQVFIGTTRPELIPGCVAVFFHPEDKRYKHLEGKFLITPIFNEKVPIIADESVLIDKGTGLVMCCTFGDEMDVKWWSTHNLPLKEVVDRYGKIALLENKKIEDARAYILERLSTAGLLQRQDPITHTVKCAERSGGKLEILSTYQWYMKILDYKDQILEMVKTIEWIPSRMRVKIEQWVEGIKWDWCISRQRYLGVRVPILYDQDTDEILVPLDSDLPLSGESIIKDGRQYRVDSDVLDTWATSSLTPQINHSSMYPNKGSDLSFRPMSLRPQAHEIIRTWAFYTILRAYLEYGAVPWEKIMVSGWCLAHDKTKMSKSKGNTIDPLVLIDQYGSEVVRYWSASAANGADTYFSENVFLVGKKLVNKLWSVSRFAEQFIREGGTIRDIKYPTDIWITNRLASLVGEMTAYFDRCDYASAKLSLEKFFLREYCDNYIELVKARAYGDVEGNRSAVVTLATSLSVLLKLFAPFFPFISDEIHNALFPKESSIHACGSWPRADDLMLSEDFPGEELVEILSRVREFKSENNISIKKEVALVEIRGGSECVKQAEYDIMLAVNAKKVCWVDSTTSELQVHVES